MLQRFASWSCMAEPGVRAQTSLCCFWLLKWECRWTGGGHIVSPLFILTAPLLSGTLSIKMYDKVQPMRVDGARRRVLKTNV